MSKPESVEASELTEPTTHAGDRSISFRRRGLLLALLVGATAILGVMIAKPGEGPPEDDLAAKLKSLGAIAVMDSSRRYVSSVNLSLVEEEEQVAQSFELLKELRKIESLNMSDVPVKAEFLEVLAGLPTLKSLTLTGSGLDDDGLKRIARVNGIESLVLSNTDVTGGGLSSLSDMIALKILDLSNLSVESGLESLTQLPKLEWIVLREAKLSKGTLSALSKSKGLTTVSLQDATYDQEDLALLQANLPNLRVEK